MRISQIVQPIREAIPNRPRSIAYYANRAKSFPAIQAAFERAGELLKGRFPEYELEKIIHTHDEEFQVHQFVDLAYALRMQHGPFDLKPLGDAMEAFVKFTDSPGHDFYRYIPEQLKHLDAEIENKKWVFPILDHVPSPEQLTQWIATDTDWQLLDPEFHEPEEIQQTQNFIEAMRLLHWALPRYTAALNDLRQKIGAFLALRAGAWSSGGIAKWRPEHGEIETLYHASAYANEIVQQGFSAELPQGRLGVGNLGSQSEISFTHDFKIATDIVRCLKELAMIANGQLKARQVADWIRRENIPNFPWHEFMKVNTGYNEFLQPQYEPTTFDRFSIVQTAKLYEKYIWLSKIHPNPVFMHVGDLVKTLVGRPQQDIGVLACQVRLDPNESTYKHGEAEFRVKPDAIQSIKRVM